MTDASHPDCSVCRHNRARAEQYSVAWWCDTHGDCSYDPAARIRRLEGDAARYRRLLTLAHEHLAAFDARLVADSKRGGMGVNIVGEQLAAVRTVRRRIERAADIPADQEPAS